MATIEKGELFVVIRGFEHGRGSLVLAGLYGETKPEKPSYDRHFEGVVLRAEEVCGPVIAARVVWVGNEVRYKLDMMGKTHSLNTTECEVWPVTQQYLDALNALGADAAPAAEGASE